MFALHSHQVPTFSATSADVQMVVRASSLMTVAPTTYYISLSGSDRNSGTSPNTPWKSLSKINSLYLNPGDQVLFQGGYTYSGNLSFTQEDNGTATAPIMIGSYGTGRATINAGTGTGINIYNAAGYNISNLKIVGSGVSTNTKDGINIYNDLAGNIKLDTITINNVDVSGFGNYGIAIGAWNQQSGFRNIKITNVLSQYNGEGGLITYAQVPNVNENVYVGYMKAYNNGGTSFPSDVDGIVLGGVKGGMIERSIAYNNIGKGGVGIWTYDSTNMTIQYNESYNNRTTSGSDGGGFDLDQNVSNSTMQYNYSHDNDGAGYLLCQAPTNPNYGSNVVRYNISQNDGRKNGFGGIDIYGQVYNTELYNNTIFMGATLTGTPVAIRVWNSGVSGQVSGLHIRNNIFQTKEGVSLVSVSPSQVSGTTDFLFQNNAYYTIGMPFKISWNDTNYSSLASWRIATGQERLNGQTVGMSVDPQLINPGGGGTIGNPDLLNTLNAYKLRSTSPLINQGLDLKTLFGINPGTHDFYGISIAQGIGYDVGAGEF